jgi:hypothetical protein
MIDRSVSLFIMHLTHEIPGFAPGMIVDHRQGMLSVRGGRQIVDPFPARVFYEFVGEVGFLIPASLFKLVFEHGFRLGALAGLLIEGLDLCLVGVVCVYTLG